MEYKGAIYRILEDVYAQKCSGYMSDVKKRIIRLQLTLKTGLNIPDFTSTTNDRKEDIEKLLSVIRGQEVGLPDYQFKF